MAVDEYRDCIAALLSRTGRVPMAELNRIFEALSSGQLEECRAAALLTALNGGGRSTARKIVSAVRVFRKTMRRLDLRGRDAVDTCGTGGDRTGSYNISTAAALIVAGTGLPVVKHGNRSASSKSGSADVLERLGVPIEAGVEWAQRCLDDFDFAFCFAPHFHPAMKQVAAVRRKLGFPTIFNWVGPLLNPASAPYQLIGIGPVTPFESFHIAASHLGARRIWVVRGEDGLDEITLGADTECGETIGADERGTFAISPDSFGLGRIEASELRADSPEESAGIIERILAGEDTPHSRVAIANAAAALAVAGRAENLFNGVEMSRQSIASGKAQGVLNRLRKSR